MKVLLLCGVFAKENEQEILKNSKKAVEYSANIFQEKLINGFKEICADFSVLSAPLIGAYPNGYRKAFFGGFENSQKEYKYVTFNNIWGLRNFSRAKALKKSLKDFIGCKDRGKLIVVYSVHTPFLEAAVYAKKKDPNIKICIVIPDLPQYMNLDARKSLLYRIGKKYDIRRFNRLNKAVDSYVFLTETMAEKVNIYGRPYFVAEGIVDKDQIKNDISDLPTVDKDTGCQYIVYTGKIYERFGVKNLIDAFMLLPNENYRLVICGKGDLQSYVESKAKKDLRIKYLGQVSAGIARAWVLNADVLVNPRQNNEEYTKYSFPSKNIEYLISGKPVVAYLLDGMKKCYEDFLIVPETDSIESLSLCICRALNMARNKKDYSLYVTENLMSGCIVKKILSMSLER